MKLIDFFSVILPRPPDADRPDTLFPDTTLVRAPMRQLKTRKQCWRRCTTQAIRMHGSLPTVRLVEQVTRTCPVFFQRGPETSMTRRLAAFVTLTSLTAAIAAPVLAAPPPFETVAPVAYMKDLSYGAVLYAKNSAQPQPQLGRAHGRERGGQDG